LALARLTPHVLSVYDDRLPLANVSLDPISPRGTISDHRSSVSPKGNYPRRSILSFNSHLPLRLPVAPNLLLPRTCVALPLLLPGSCIALSLLNHRLPVAPGLLLPRTCVALPLLLLGPRITLSLLYHRLPVALGLLLPRTCIALPLLLLSPGLISSLLGLSLPYLLCAGLAGVAASLLRAFRSSPAVIAPLCVNRNVARDQCDQRERHQKSCKSEKFASYHKSPFLKN
jgi:hypothetical protein